MLDPAAYAAAAESEDPFALARLLHPEAALARVVDESSGWELVLAIPRPSAAATAYDGDTITINRKAKAGAETAPPSSSIGAVTSPAPADASRACPESIPPRRP
jgi:hypothetical protein